MMKGSARGEFSQQWSSEGCNCCPLASIRILPMRLFLRWCFFALVLSIGMAPCSTFPVEKNVIERSKPRDKGATSSTDLFGSAFPLSPSCIGRLTMPGVKVTQNKTDGFRATTIHYHVIGTSHFRCNSYKEVSALIREKQPDGVVIELDPERLLRLTLDDATVRTTSTTDTSANMEDSIKNRWFGGDFLSAIETSKELDIPIFLGDEYPIETRRRFTNTLFDLDSYSAENLLMAMKSFFRPRLIRSDNVCAELLSVDVFGTFLEDPRKLLPLAATLSLPVLAVVFTIFLDATGAKASSHYEALATLLSLVTSYVALCKVYNNLIADRDIVLASNVQRAATTVAMLKSNQLIRKRWTFTVNDSDHEDTPKEVPDKAGNIDICSTSIPLFTLKNPLEQNAVRNLNLFEPRWLKMIDRLLLLETQQEEPKAGNVDAAAPSSASSNSQQRLIGCVTCANKFYSAINVAKASENKSSFQEGRYADVIFRRRGRFGELTGITEGSRPSGARKVGAKILGKEAFELPSLNDENGNDGISVVREGYLTASGLRPIDEDKEINKSNVENTPDEINIVVVVGLLHANGVLDCLLKEYSDKNNEQTR